MTPCVGNPLCYGSVRALAGYWPQMEQERVLFPGPATPGRVCMLCPGAAPAKGHSTLRGLGKVCSIISGRSQNRQVDHWLRQGLQVCSPGFPGNPVRGYLPSPRGAGQ